MMSFSEWGNQLYTGKKSYNIVGHSKWWYTIAVVMLLISGLVVGIKGLNPGIEFRGGSEFIVSNVENIDEQKAADAVSSVNSEEPPRTSVVGSNSIRVQTAELTSVETEQARTNLATAFGVPESDVTASFVGPTWGSDVTGKAVQGLIIFLVLVSLVMAFYFRAWKMAAAAITGLLHDLVVTVGIYAIVGFEVTPASVIGFLTILGYSLYDTVVVFDKVRENTADIEDQTRYTYPEAANLAINQTLVRSINTTVVALLPVSAILFIGAFVLGAGTLRDISLALFIGMAVGAYSSIFIATPLEVTFRRREPRLIAQAKRVAARRDADAKAAEAAANGEGTAAEIESARVLAETGMRLPNAAQPKRKRKK